MGLAFARAFFFTPTQEAALAADPKSDGKKVTVELKRAHWIGEDRHEPGELIEVDYDKALDLIENGVAGRTDPLKAN